MHSSFHSSSAVTWVAAAKWQYVVSCEYSTSGDGWESDEGRGVLKVITVTACFRRGGSYASRASYTFLQTRSSTELPENTEHFLTADRHYSYRGYLTVLNCTHSLNYSRSDSCDGAFLDLRWLNPPMVHRNVHPVSVPRTSPAPQSVDRECFLGPCRYN